MRDFFKLRRRKYGLVTLVMACVLMVGWIRSHFRFEFIDIPVGNSAIGVTSMHGGLDFSRVTSLENKPVSNSIEVKSVELFINPKEPSNRTPWGPDFVFDWRWDWAGFHIGAGQYSSRRDQDCMIPYWALVMPLSLLSAWFLLSTGYTQKKVAWKPNSE